MKFFKRLNKKEEKLNVNSKEAAKERLHLVLMQDRANVSADFLELMKQEIIEVIKKYIDVDENAIDVRLTNKGTTDGANGAPALYANIPIINIKNDARKVNSKEEKEEPKQAEVKDNKDKNNKDNKKTIKEEKKEASENTEKSKNEKSVEKEAEKKIAESETKKEDNKKTTKKVEKIKKAKEKVKSE